MAALIYIQQEVGRNRLVRPVLERLYCRGIASISKERPVRAEAKRDPRKRTGNLRRRCSELRSRPLSRRRRRGFWRSHLNELPAREKFRVLRPDVDEAIPRDRNHRALQ